MSDETQPVNILRIARILRDRAETVPVSLAYHCATAREILALGIPELSYEAPAVLSVEQQIRLGVTKAIIDWSCWDVQPGTEDGFARELTKVVAPIARYVESGNVEPLPSLETAGVAESGPGE